MIIEDVVKPPRCFLAMFTLTILGAGGVASLEAADATDVNQSPVSESIVLFARYGATLPCADCAGIEIELSIYVEGPNKTPATFELRETYIFTEADDRTETKTGHWTALMPSAAHPDAR